MTDIKDTLEERGTRYGVFQTQAEYAQGMKAIFAKSPNWATMKEDQREALDMIANKIGRILNGDPNYADSWHDIGGYAKLVEERLTSNTAPRGFEPGDVVRIGAVDEDWDGWVEELDNTIGNLAMVIRQDIDGDVHLDNDCFYPAESLTRFCG